MIAVGGQETSFDADARETLPRLPLADATLALWAFVWQPAVLDGVLLQCGGGSFEAPLRFAGFVELMGDALLQHAGRGRQSFARAQAPGTLPTAIAAGYGKLRRVPLGLSLGFFADSTARLGRLLPAGLPATELPPSRAGLTGVVGAGQTLQRVATRRLPARRVAGKGYGGKGRVAALPVQGLAVARAADPDGEANEWRLVPQLRAQARRGVTGPRFWVWDRQFGALVQTARCTQDGAHFLIRYHPKVHFHPDPRRPPHLSGDTQGRPVSEEGGWLGAAETPRRRYVRRITLERVGEEAVGLVTDLLAAERYPAADLLSVYLARWGSEGVFQQIPEVFALPRLIGSTPPATVFQAAFCLGLSNRGQVVRGYIAAARPEPCLAETLSAEQIFSDVQRELPAVSVLLPPAMVAAGYTEDLSVEPLRQRLHGLLSSVWTPRGRKATNTKPRPQGPKAKQSGARYCHAPALRSRSPATPSKCRQCLTKDVHSSGVRAPLRATWCPVYASPVSFGSTSRLPPQLPHSV